MSAAAELAEPVRGRMRIDVTGAVQGVGFRPFVHRLATAEGLAGEVCNTTAGACIEIEGPASFIDRFLSRLGAELPLPARIDDRLVTALPPTGEQGFAVVASRLDGAADAVPLPDLAVCDRCLTEIHDPGDRRYRYPFTTCTHCGPRYSVTEALPWDRERTTMRHFPLCPACAAEYADPASRRFHAETIACPDCGPQLSLRDKNGRPIAGRDEALVAAASAIREGRIVALKGLGGFQLVCNAHDSAAVARLRTAKRRPAKPFAVMVESLSEAGSLAELDAAEATLLASPAAPIVLVKARADNGLAGTVAPGSPLLGLMLPATPLHHLLLADVGGPVVATSGNRGGEPIVHDEAEAAKRLAGLADLLLVHDRPILRPVDDSVTRVVAGAPVVLRLARGYAPLALKSPAPASGLALGGQQKAAVAVASGRRIVLGPHIGDLETVESRAALATASAALPALVRTTPQWVACDAHPDYHGSSLARRLGPRPVAVPHHLAHVLSAMLDNDLDGPVLGFAWDGSGYGRDGTIWGGETLAVDAGRWRRVAHLLPFRLPGGDAAIREPRRSALGALHAIHGDAGWNGGWVSDDGFAPSERRVLQTMLRRGLNAPVTTSAGRLFDVVASLLGLCQRQSFEGEAAMAVEFAAGRAGEAEALAPVVIAGVAPLVVDWRATISSLVERREGGAPIEGLALGFHHALADAIVATAERAAVADVVLTGGCFQNALLAELATARLDAAGFRVHRHRQVPPNDGGLAAGQACFAARPLVEETA